jgi:hypothetical protein
MMDCFKTRLEEVRLIAITLNSSSLYFKIQFDTGMWLIGTMSLMQTWVPDSTTTEPTLLGDLPLRNLIRYALKAN